MRPKTMAKIIKKNRGSDLSDKRTRSNRTYRKTN